MRSVRSAQRQVELRRLGNQLPVLSKANSLCKIVKYCVFCLFVKLRLSPGDQGPGIKLSQVMISNTGQVGDKSTRRQPTRRQLRSTRRQPRSNRRHLLTDSATTSVISATSFG